MNGREKMEKNYVSFAIYPPRWPCSLWHRSVAGESASSRSAAVLPAPAARLHCRRWGIGWSICCRFVNWWCWSFTMRRLPLPSPRFWQPTISLLFLLICSHQTCARPARRLPPLCHCALCIFMLYPILLCVLPRTFEVPISGISAKFWSQHLFPTLSRCSHFGAFEDVTFLILCFSETQVTWSTDTIVKVLI